ncbi:hypothetical protein QRQ56_19445 [Bradyrhizobium sp. U531]|uniref:hypothetical protein n=1 Tax=Bradyrhizobium sp. U531 TaxID=3053458 RepID=UPI003F440F84
MPFLILLMLAFASVLHGFGAAADGVSHVIDSLSNAGFFQWLGSIEWSAMFKWFRSAQMAPQLPFENEALHNEFQRFMDMQFQIGELKRQMLTMPALPTEGF